MTILSWHAISNMLQNWHKHQTYKMFIKILLHQSDKKLVISLKKIRHHIECYQDTFLSPCARLIIKISEVIEFSQLLTTRWNNFPTYKINLFSSYLQCWTIWEQFENLIRSDLVFVSSVCQLVWTWQNHYSALNRQTPHNSKQKHLPPTSSFHFSRLPRPTKLCY